MTTQKRTVNDETQNQIARASTLSPRLDYAAQLVDKILEELVQRKFELHIGTLSLYTKKKANTYISLEFERQLNIELEVFRAVEALRQVRSHIDSVFGLGNIIQVLAPTISIVRTIRARLLFLFPEADVALGELSLVLGGLMIDSGQLTGAKLDFQEANHESTKLLDEAKLIADSKISKQFPNLDLL
ncbi:MAG: hypothetical protein WDZ43_00040 [Nitrosopumilaceae archaeon]